MKKPCRFDLSESECGASLLEVALLLPFFLFLIMGAVDFGRAYYLATEIAGSAQAAAIYGSQNPTDTTGMKTAAQDDAPDVPGLTVGTPTYYCECSDGTSSSQSCAKVPACTGMTEVYRVNVTVTGTYTPIFPWSWTGMGIPSSISFSSSASMRSAGS